MLINKAQKAICWFQIYRCPIETQTILFHFFASTFVILCPAEIWYEIILHQQKLPILK